jgi:hypothetical protein
VVLPFRIGILILVQAMSSYNEFPNLRTLKAAFLNANTFIVTIHPNPFACAILLCLKLPTCAESSEAAFYFVATVSCAE